MKNTKEKLTIITLFSCLLVTMCAHFILEDQEVSYSERRKLKQAPKITLASVTNKDFSEELETYLLDQFPNRDTYRTINAYYTFDVLQQLDYNGIFQKDGMLSKLDQPLHKNQVQHFIDLFDALHTLHFQDANVVVGIIPDKNYYLTKDTLYSRLDYNELFSMVKNGFPYATYVDLTSSLNQDNYYTTDAHWKQETLLDVANVLKQALSIDGSTKYTSNTLDGFYGGYYKQYALPMESDCLTYLTNPTIEQAIVRGIELKKPTSIYDPSKIDGMDGYDVYLHGAQSILTIENTTTTSDKELLIFRDSFASSLAPLLIDDYKKITLIDLRYINSSILEEYVEFKQQDVLILYSTLLVNNAASLH